MTIARREPAYEIPPYSLTGDVLSFRRCGLQYRYYNRSKLPPSRPVQMWTGEFLHGVLEDAYRQWRGTPHFPWPFIETIDDLPRLDEPVPENWPRNHVGRMGLRMEKHLAAAGRSSRNAQARFNAYRRAAEAINVLGPDLFQLITTAEEPISGTLPISLPANSPRNADRYELNGIVDVISSVQIQEHRHNKLVAMLSQFLPDEEEIFDIIVDYKGMRRPSRGVEDDPIWDDHAWQIQTYAWLRSKREDLARVGCGLIIYLNELYPSRQDMEALRTDRDNGTSDVLPAAGSADDYAILGVIPDAEDNGDEAADAVLSLGFRLQRAIRIIGVDDHSQQEAVDRIHAVVEDIEGRVANEHVDGQIRTNWPANGRHRDCVACDFNDTCPAPAWVRDGQTKKPPRAPG